MSRRKASEISKAELVYMIARLRGVVAHCRDTAAMYEHQEYVDVEVDPIELLKALDLTAIDDDLNTTYSGYVEAEFERATIPAPNPPAMEGKANPPLAQHMNWFRATSRDTAHLGPFTMVRACEHCGVLVSGGPTACAYCVERLALLKLPAQGRRKR